MFTSFFQTISLSFNIFRPAFNFGIHSSTINIFSKKSRRSKVGFDIYVTKKKISHAFSREPFQRGSRSGSALEKIGNFIWRGCATEGCSRWSQAITWAVIAGPRERNRKYLPFPGLKASHPPPLLTIPVAFDRESRSRWWGGVGSGRVQTDPSSIRQKRLTRSSDSGNFEPRDRSNRKIGENRLSRSLVLLSLFFFSNRTSFVTPYTERRVFFLIFDLFEGYSYLETYSTGCNKTIEIFVKEWFIKTII